jgi:hypothetical protein
LAHGVHHSNTPQLAVSPLLVVAVIVAVHGVTQVTNPVVLTVAIVESDEVQLITSFLGASSGSTVAVNCTVCQIVVRLIELLSSSIDSG